MVTVPIHETLMKLPGNDNDGHHHTGDGENATVVAGDVDGLGDVDGGFGDADEHDADDGGDDDDDDKARGLLQLQLLR